MTTGKRCLVTFTPDLPGIERLSDIPGWPKSSTIEYEGNKYTVLGWTYVDTPFDNQADAERWAIGDVITRWKYPIKQVFATWVPPNE